MIREQKTVPGVATWTTAASEEKTKIQPPCNKRRKIKKSAIKVRKTCKAIPE